MREIRTFELEHGEAPAVWHAARPCVLTVSQGEVWLTLDGDPEDYWLAAGESFALQDGARAWVSAGRGGARISLAFASAGSRSRLRARSAPSGRSWMPRWLSAA